MDKKKGRGKKSLRVLNGGGCEARILPDVDVVESLENRLKSTIEHIQYFQDTITLMARGMEALAPLIRDQAEYMDRCRRSIERILYPEAD